jgi:hypothetical protein
MKNVILALTVFLSGCAIVPYGVSTRSEIRIDVSPVALYSIYERVYYWDPRLALYFYWDRGYRVYMPRQWNAPIRRHPH